MLEIPRFLKFCTVGLSGVVVNTVILYMLKEYAILPLSIASIIAIISAMIWNFCINDCWTFRKVEAKFSRQERFLAFVALCSIGGLLDFVILMVLTGWGVYYLISNLIGIAAAVGWNYMANKKVTWGN